MKIELSEDEIETIQGVLESFEGILTAGLYWLPDDEEREVSLACQMFDAAVEQAKKDVSVAKLNLAIKMRGKKNGNIN